MPAAAADAVSLAAAVRAMFSRAVDAATVTTDRVRLLAPGGVPRPATVRV